MKILSLVNDSLGLLESKDRRRLGLLALLQSALALVDVVGLALLGYVVLVGSSEVTQPVSSAAHKMGPFSLPTTTSYSLVLIAGAAGILLVGKSAASYGLTRYIYRFLAGRQVVVSTTLAQRFFSWPLLQVLQRNSLDSAHALTRGVSALIVGVLGSATILVADAVLVGILLIALTLVSLQVTIFAAIFFVLVGVLLQRVLADWAHRVGREVRENEVASTGAVQDAVLMYREMIVGDRTSYFVSKFAALRLSASAAQADSYLMNVVSKYIYEVALIIGGGILAAWQLRSTSVESALAIVAVFIAASTRILPSLMRMQQSLLLIRSAGGEAEGTVDLASELRTSCQDLGDNSQERRSLRHPGPEVFVPEIQVRDVSLVYPGNPLPSLSAVSLSLGAGERLAIVGPSGSGKSSLADVLLGVIEPTEGRVLMSGMPPRDALSKWPGEMAYVPQDAAVLDGSIKENVSLHEDPRTEDVWSALERAHLADFVSNLPNGIMTIVGERGARLSGGQRQRLGLARALYNNPRLLVLDEATSALDAETESLVTQTISRLPQGITQVIIAHRLATIRAADRILYLNEGKIAAQGTFDEVRELVPDFEKQAQLLGIT